MGGIAVKTGDIGRFQDATQNGFGTISGYVEISGIRECARKLKKMILRCGMEESRSGITGCGIFRDLRLRDDCIQDL